MDKIESLLVKLQERKTEELSKEELLAIIQEKFEGISRVSLKRVVDELYSAEYDKVQKEYLESISESVEKLMQLIADFKESDRKPAVLKQIVKTLKAEKRMLISRSLSSELVYPILYALDMRDLETSAYLMESRMKILSQTDIYGPKTIRSENAIDRMDLMDKFVDIIATECDDKKAEVYIKDLSRGKYASTLRVEGGRYFYIGEESLREMLLECRSKNQSLEQ